MKEYIQKLKEWYKNTPESWKSGVIEKARKDNILFIPKNEDKDYLYDMCVEYLFAKSPKRIQNLAKKMGYNEVPCLRCRKTIEYWNDNEDFIYGIETAKHFE